MISAIVYTSNSGYTAEYARLLGRATGLPVNDLRQVHTPQPDEEVIFLGWLMADRVMGWPKANAFFKVRAVCQVGMGPASAAAAAAPTRSIPAPGFSGANCRRQKPMAAASRASAAL